MGDELNLGQSVQDGIRIGNMFAQAFSWAFFLLTRPIVLVTQVFFRKELGERYFTRGQAISCLVLILIAMVITAETSTVTSYQNYQNEWGMVVRTDKFVTATWQANAAYALGIVWAGAFLLATLQHYRMTLRQRRQHGILWHSRSDGVPRWPVLNIHLELAIIAVCTVILFWAKLYAFGALAGLSLLFTSAADSHAKKQLYNRVLDAIDGQIESEWMGKAIEQRLSANDAHGLNASLPAHVSDEYRKRVAALFKNRATA